MAPKLLRPIVLHEQKKESNKDNIEEHYIDEINDNWQKMMSVMGIFPTSREL